MDSGLVVRWPLSPYATALAAGALVAICVALWKNYPNTKRGTRKDSGDQNGSNGLVLWKNCSCTCKGTESSSYVLRRGRYSKTEQTLTSQNASNNITLRKSCSCTCSENYCCSLKSDKHIRSELKTVNASTGVNVFGLSSTFGQKCNFYFSDHKFDKSFVLCYGARREIGNTFSTQISSYDLDPPDKKDADEKKKKEKETGNKKFPVLEFADVKSDFENLCSGARFGAIPRTTIPQRRHHTLQAPHIFSPLQRRRNIELGNRNWPTQNPLSLASSLPCIYQPTCSLGNEVPRLNTRFVLNSSPYLNQYFRQFHSLRDFRLPEFTRKSEFENFDVSINPEILKDKPITRSAVRLTLEKQLHKFLGEERSQEAKLNERATQSVGNYSDIDDNLGFSNQENVQGLGSTITSKSGVNEYSQHISTSSSLWDSGYYEKPYDDQCSSRRGSSSDVVSLHSNENHNSGTYRSTGNLNNEIRLACSPDYSIENQCSSPNQYCCRERLLACCCSELKNVSSNLKNKEYVQNCNTSNDVSNDSTENSSPKSTFSCDETLNDLNDITSNTSSECTLYCAKPLNDINEFTRIAFPESSVNCDETLSDISSNVTSECTLYCDGIKYDLKDPTGNDFPESTLNCDETLNNLSDSTSNTSPESIINCDETLKDINDTLNNSPDNTLNCDDTLKDLSDSPGNSPDNTLNCDETLKNLSDSPDNSPDNTLNCDETLKNLSDSSSTESTLKCDETLNDLSPIAEDSSFNESAILPESVENLNNEENMSASTNTEDQINIAEKIQDENEKSNVQMSLSDNTEEDKKFKIVEDSNGISRSTEMISDLYLGFQVNDENVQISSDVKIRDEKVSQIPNEYKLVSPITTESIKSLSLGFQKLELERFQETLSSLEKEGHIIRDDENIFLSPENILDVEKNQDYATRASGVDVKNNKSIAHFEYSNLEGIQNARSDSDKENGDSFLSSALKPESCSRVVLENDVTRVSSRDPAVFDEKETLNTPRQMDRETGERSVAVESTVTTETTLRDGRVSTAVVSRLTLDDWSADREDSVSVKTTVTEEIYRPTFEEFIPESSKGNIRDEESVSIKISENKTKESGSDSLPLLPPDDRLKRLLSRDEERRARTKFQHLATDESHVGGAGMEGEWDRLLRDVLANVSELERWEQRECDVRSNAEDAEQHPSLSQSDSSFVMEEEVLSPNKGETPTKIKNLRFKLDPDVFDVPSDDSFYDDDDDDVRRGWKKQTKYRAFSSLELTDEPVRLVSVHASVVPAGQKMVARPVGIDLRVRLTEERQSKRAHVSTSPSQAKRRSPVSDRGVGWCQELSPVTENVDWRDTFTPVTPPDCTPKSVPNGILKTPSPKMDPPPVESPNPFKLENGVTTNGVSPVIEKKRVDKPKYNGLPWKPTERKPLSLPRKKFEPDPEAIERITGYKIALSKPPLPPPVFDKIHANKLLAIKKAELARKQYLDSRAALSANKVDSTIKFQQFLNQAQSDRARIVTSVPDLAAIERAVTEQWLKERASVSPRESPAKENGVKSDDVDSTRGSTPDDKWASYVQSCRQHLGRRSQSMTYLETDIDIIPILDDDDKCVSTSALDESDEALPDPDDSDMDRSREDLDDSGRAKSEHELRIERSLRSMPVPEWYKRSDKTKSGFLLNNSTKEKRGWAAAKSLASSTSSLASCGLRRPVRSLRSSRENIPWSRSSASPDGPSLSLALAKAFREPYLGWRARTPTSSGVSSSPRASPPSWNATTTDDEANGVSFDGEDAFGRTTSSEEDRRDEPLSLDDTGADAVTVSMDTNDPVKLPGGEDTCDDINNMSMDTCEMFDASIVVPVDDEPSLLADTGDDIDNLSTDTTTEGRKLESKLDLKQNSKLLDPKLKRYSYSQSIYHSELGKEVDSRGDFKAKMEETRELSPTSPDHKVVWIESSFVGSRTTTSILVLPEDDPNKAPGNTQERPASR